MKYLFLIYFCFYSIENYSQNEITSEYYYKWFDSVININNTNLLNGVEFIEKYRTVEGNNQYFLMYDFLPGYLVYDGQPYYDIQMKYDVNSDDLIIKLYNNLNGQFAIQLIKDRVEKFQIDNHLFINSNYLESSISTLNKKGFIEVISQNNNLSAYKRHIKSNQQRRNDLFAYTKFVYRNIYFVNYNNKLNVIRNKKDLTKLFPDQKKIINKFYSKYRLLMKSNFDHFLKTLTEHLDELINNKTSYK